ncbi:MAG TPA: ribonuclease Z [Solirubrobacterales bacterium]|nr:ribonuclease Z [Solirubrobacterales bacterium]
MDLEAIFLGTGGSVPSARRNTAAVLVRRGGDRLLFDCGEGTQRQMQRSIGLLNLDAIFITHLHADHYLGLPGLIKSYEMQDREERLVIYGPPGLRTLFAALSRIIGKPRYGLDLVELNRGEAVDFGDYEVEPFDVSHGVVANGYALREDPRPGRFDPEAARALGVEPGPAFSELQDGRPVPGRDGLVAPDQVMGEDRPGRTIVITGDTEPCEETEIAAEGAELLVHDGSFAAAESDRAAETGHSTALAAAEVAAVARVGMLALVHISSRHFVPDILEEARAAFAATVAPRDFDLIAVPLPERGGPELIADGARAAPPAAEEPASSEKGSDRGG